MAVPSPLSASLIPPYTAVIFTARRTNAFQNQYTLLSERLESLVTAQPGYLGMESVRGEDRIGITVSYWRDRKSAQAWKEVAEHMAAQQLGRSQFYEWYRVRIATVEAEWGFGP